MKDLIILLCGIVILIDLLFIIATLKISSEVENGEYDIKSSKNRKTKANK